MVRDMTRNQLTEHLLGREISVRFVSIREAVRLHDQSIIDVGGLLGVRDAALLESALHRPMQQCLYDETTDLCVLAASLADAVVQNHAFLDGNKRTAFLCAVLFLEKNGVVFQPDVADAVEWFRKLANHETDALATATWIEANSGDPLLLDQDESYGLR